MAKTNHILWCIGTRIDFPPHSHRWCIRCGAVEDFGLPKDLDVLVLEGKKFAKLHKNCPETEENKLGYLKYYDKYVWGGTLSIDEIAWQAFRTATSLNCLTEEYCAPAYNKNLAVAAIEEMITCKFEVSRKWFSLNYGELLGYKNQESHDKVWPSMRFATFLNTAYGLLKEKY